MLYIQDTVRGCFGNQCMLPDLYMQTYLPVSDCKIHVEWLAEVKLKALKQIWLQRHCKNIQHPADHKLWVLL